MSVIGMESFGHAPDGAVSSADLLSNVWTAVSGGLFLTDLGGGRKAIKSTDQSGSIRLVIDSSGLTELIVGFRLHNLTSGDAYALQFLDSGTKMGMLQKLSTGQLVYYRTGTPTGGNDILFSASTTPVGSNDYWEIRVVFDNVAGAVYLYKNGVLDNSVTGIDTIVFGASCNTIQFLNARFLKFGDFAVSDIYVDDSVVQGPCDVPYRPVDASGSSADFTPTGAGTNEDCVDEIPPDDDTTYNGSTVTADLDQLGQAGMDGAVGGVLAVQSHIRARKEDALGSNVKVGLLHSGSHGQGSAIALSTSYQQYTEIFEDVPGGAGWTPAQLDATEVTYENVS